MASPGSPVHGGMTVSRIGRVRRLDAGKLRKTMPRRRMADVMFAPQPIEDTLQKRQALQPSYSSPALIDSFTEREPLVLPRISVARKRVPSAGSPCQEQAHFPASPQTPDPARSSSKVADRESWINLLNGGRRVGIPFSMIGGSAVDTDVFVRWYQSAQEEAQHQQSLQDLQQPDEQGSSFLEVWSGGEGDLVTRLRAAPRGSGEDLHLRGQIRLYQHLDELEESGRKPGSGALLEALRYKLGSEDDLSRLLDVSRNGELSLMEFAGCMGLLGLDTEVLCGLDEQSLFRSLDHRQSGAVRLRDLLGPWHQHAPPRASEGASSTEAERVLAKWVLIGRWMAVAARRSAAMREHRYLQGWRMTDAGVAAAASALAGTADGETEAPAEARPVTAEAAGERRAPGAGAGGRGGGGRCRAPALEVLLETAAALRERDRKLRALFSAAASVDSEGGVQLMRRSDVRGFFADLHAADPQRGRAVKPELLDAHYDETLALQASATQVRNGLVFWSFKAFLNNITKDLGLGWEGLVEYTIDLGVRDSTA